MPGQGMPNFRRNGMMMAKHGIHDLRQHLEEVVMPVCVSGASSNAPTSASSVSNAATNSLPILLNWKRQVAKFEEQRD